MVHQLKNEKEFQTILGQHQYVIVDCWAGFCGPCKRIAPAFEALANEYPQVFFLKMDVEKFDDLANELEISGLPSFVIFKNGKQAHDTIEGANIDNVKKALNAVLSQ
jgi:thioredoxin 1